MPAQVNVVEQNYKNRMNLINTGLHMIKKLPVVSGDIGSQLQIQLQRMGILTGVMLYFSAQVTPTVAATVSDYGPYSLVKQISYTDYAGIQRVITSGYQLHVLNCFRGHRFMNNANINMKYMGATSETGVDTNILNVPTAAAAATLYFALYVPIAYDPLNDLRGAVLSQTIYGDHYITIQFANAWVDATDEFAAPYSAGTVALTAGQQINVQAYQQYIMPQQGVNNLPMIDLSTIYAVEGNYQDSSNIVANQAKYINWPNNRAIMSAVHVFDNGGSGVANQTDVSDIILLGNSNTSIREMQPNFVRNQMRYMLGADLASGVYYISSRMQPITTQLYGNVQTQFNVATANANAYFNSQYESTYLAGTPLPGVVQG